MLLKASHGLYFTYHRSNHIVHSLNSAGRGDYLGAKHFGGDVGFSMGILFLLE